MYSNLAERLASEGATPADLVTEQLFLRDLGRLSTILGVRARVLGATGPGGPPLPSFIQQPPIDGQALELLATGLVPGRRASATTRDQAAETACRCDGCIQSSARLIRLGNETTLHSTNLYGVGRTAYEQARDMFAIAAELLERCGMDVHDVVRTWIHLREIDRDYDALNRARREFFSERGIDPRPASTGVQGGPFPHAHDVSLRVQAIRSVQPRRIAVMSTPSLNEAWSYGADFSRGLRVEDSNKVTLHVSGTASVDEQGRTAHVGDFPRQAERMLHNLASLLTPHGAGFAQVVSGVIYLKHPSDGAALRTICAARGFTGFPCPIVHAPLCRPDLLCEAEAVAMLPLAAGRA